MTYTEVEIFIATHKSADFPDDKGYIPLHVGKGRSTVDLGIRGDNTGDNISHLNPFFCELTGLYWLWKNSSAPITGLVHYRRFIAAAKKEFHFLNQNIASSDDFAELRSDCDLIVFNPMSLVDPVTKMPWSNEQHYCHFLGGLDLPLARDAVEDMDKSYIPHWDFIMRINKCSVCNVMIGKRRWISEYCEWLFPILFKLERQIPYLDYNPFEQRVFGFLAEKLLNVWISRNRKFLHVRFRNMIFYP